MHVPSQPTKIIMSFLLNVNEHMPYECLTKCTSMVQAGMKQPVSRTHGKNIIRRSCMCHEEQRLEGFEYTGRCVCARRAGIGHS